MSSAKVHALAHAKRDAAQYEEHYTWDKDRGEAVRPYRLWDAVARKNLRWRNYKDPRAAHLGALIECRWSAIGHSIEVYDVRTGRLLGQYTRRISSVQFSEG